MGRFSELMIERYNNYPIDSLADHWGLDFYELAEQNFEIIPELNNDGIEVGYLVVIAPETEAAFLAQVPEINDHTARVASNIIDDADPFNYEYDAIEAAGGLADNFNREIANLRELNAVDLQNEALNAILKRQIYIAVIGTMESFLSETFVRETMAERTYLERFVKSHPEFASRKFALKDVFEAFENIRDLSKTIMLDTIYHNLRNVREMYKSTLEIEFPEIREALRCVNIRHDLVHRNGRTKEGEEIPVSEEIVENLIQIVNGLVQGIAINIHQRNALPF
jgi:hypothetical protein